MLGKHLLIHLHMEEFDFLVNNFLKFGVARQEDHIDTHKGLLPHNFELTLEELNLPCCFEESCFEVDLL